MVEHDLTDIDSYYTLAKVETAEYKEKSSKFIAFAIPIQNSKELEQHLEKIKKEHFKARHWCYAYKIGEDYRINDDGEPSGTAGRPILGQIQSFQLDQVLIIVVRYYGGIKLGTSGLINAYKTAAKDALTNAKIIKKARLHVFDIIFDYTYEGKVMQELKRFDVKIINKNYYENISIAIGIPSSGAIDFRSNFIAALLGYEPESVNEETQVAYCQIIDKKMIMDITEM